MWWLPLRKVADCHFPCYKKFMKRISGFSKGDFKLSFYFRELLFLRCEEYFLCKYQPPEGVSSVGQHVELEIRLYLERFPPQQRYLRRLIFDYLLKRECCITGELSVSLGAGQS